MLKVKRTMLLVVVALFLLLLFLYRPWDYERVGVMIRRGMNTGQIAERLYENEVVLSRAEFVAVGKLMGLDKEIKAGYYRLRRRTPALFVYPVLARGSREYVAVTIPEGLRVQDVARIFERKELLDGSVFLRLVNDTSFVRRLGVPGRNLEGYLFPDTYYLEPVADNQESTVIKTMVDNFMRNVAPLKCGDSLPAILTMASIVEKEARLDRERPLVASVFWNRLRLKRPIESCATVMYALAWKKTQLKESDLSLDSPYNTYRYPGLPPGPICSPGRASLSAARHPDTTDYLYFVARGDGSHIFSRSYKEHMAAKMLVSQYGKR